MLIGLFTGGLKLAYCRPPADATLPLHVAQARQEENLRADGARLARKALLIATGIVGVSGVAIAQGAAYAAGVDNVSAKGAAWAQRRRAHRGAAKGAESGTDQARRLAAARPVLPWSQRRDRLLKHVSPQVQDFNAVMRRKLRQFQGKPVDDAVSDSQR